MNRFRTWPLVVGLVTALFVPAAAHAASTAVPGARHHPTGSSSPARSSNLNGTLLFNASNGTDGTELGAATGRRRAPCRSTRTSTPRRDLPGVREAFPTDPDGQELWRTDGTRAGTRQVRDIQPGAGGSVPVFLTPVAGTLIFQAFTADRGSELWESDGTRGGTTLVRNIRPGAASSDPAQLLDVGGTVFFSADDGAAHHNELWKAVPPL